MSKDLNKVQLTGRLGKDPEVKYTQQGNAVAQFTVASNRSWKTADGQGRDDTEWFNVVAWNKLGEICGEYLRKGSKVYIEGRLQTRSWDDTESGQKRYKTEVIASDMIMLDSKRDMAGAPDYGDADIGYGDAEPEPVSTRSAAPARRPPAAVNGNGNGSPAGRSASPRPTAPAPQPRRPAPPVDDEDLPF